MLAVPVITQTVINVVAYGVVLPVIILAVILFVLLSVAVLLTLLNRVVVENLQQRLVFNMSISFVNYLKTPLVLVRNRGKHLDYANHFFEVITLQKMLVVIFVILLETIIQSLLSMILLAFYHPFLLIFDIILLLCMVLVIYLPYKNAKKASAKECTAKHEIAQSLESIIASPMLSVSYVSDQYIKDQIDTKLGHYIQMRQKSFTALMKHYFGIGLIYVLANAFLLGLGGYLVIQNQLSLGQLVAAELLVNGILLGFIKLGNYLRDYYDTLAASSKVSQVMPHELTMNKATERNNMPLKTLNCTLSSVSSQNAGFALRENKPLVVYDQTKMILSEFLTGLLDSAHKSNMFSIEANGVCVPKKDYEHFFSARILVVNKSEILPESLLHNLLLNNPNNVSHEELMDYCKAFLLDGFIGSLENALETNLTSVLPLEETVAIKITLLRALLATPDVLWIDHILDDIDDAERKKIFDLIGEKARLCIVTTTCHKLVSVFTREVE